MNPFQAAYDFIKAIKTPPWWKVFMAELQTILLQIAIQVGQTYVENLTAKIEAVGQMGLTEKEKFRLVFKYGKDTLPSIKDSYLNLLIEALYQKVKATKK